MATPALRIRIAPKFPTKIQGSGGITVSRTGGVVTIDGAGVRPPATEEEAVEGIDNTKTMTPLRSKQSITVNAEQANFTPEGGANAAPRLIINKLRDEWNILDVKADDGSVADPTGATSSKNAFAEALSNNRRIHIPRGTFDLGSGVTISGVNHLRVTGEHNVVSLLQLRASGSAALKFDACENIEVSNLGVQGGGGILTGSGISLANGGGTSLIERCYIRDFPDYGIIFDGSAMAQSSGNKARDNTLLTNAGGGLYAGYAQDFWIEDNQMGSDSGYPAFGSRLDQSHYGLYQGNKHYNNVVALQVTNCIRNRILGNRMEESCEQNLFVANGAGHMIKDNLIHTASLSSSGTHNSVEFWASTEIDFDDNKVVTWNATLSKYCIQCDGASQVNLRDNELSGFGTAPLNNLMTSANIIRGNTPIAAGLNPSGAINLVGVVSANLAAGSTGFLGPNGAQATEAYAQFVVPRAGIISGFRVYSAGAPGAAQSFGYTLRKNVADTAMTATSSGAASFTAFGSGSIAVAAGDGVCLAYVISAGATATAHRYVIILE